MEDSRVIRSYRKGDEYAIARLYNLCFSESGILFPRSPQSWVWRYVSRPRFDPDSVFLAEDSGRLVASLVMTYGDMSVNGDSMPVAMIDDVSTHPDHRRRGFAAMLVQRAIDRAKDRGCRLVHLTAGTSGTGFRIYHRAGFRTVTTCDVMFSVLGGRESAGIVGPVLSLPMIAAHAILSMKARKSVDYGLRLEEMVEEDAGVRLLATYQKLSHRNGLLLAGQNYGRWLIGSRPLGKTSLFAIRLLGDIIGAMTVSSVHTLFHGRPAKIASIMSPLMPEELRTVDPVAAALKRAGRFSAARLDCVAATLLTDSRDTITKKACQRVGFLRVGSTASMVHPLGEPGRIGELRKGLWAQPLETAKSAP
ncbi:MAG: hypothetical protein C4K49_12200 [Candidatus Thorarchaeota archaeon]|nr:MAG: hypothetical protein C4K49_12200 [Candidatus Thorarchaeota archaeon]